MLIAVVLVSVVAVYLNWSYAYIYDRISAGNLKTPDRIRTYVIANHQATTSDPARQMTYSALGDSLTSGVGADDYSQSYPYLLAQYFAGNDYQLTLEDRSVPGAKTSDLMQGLLATAIGDQPDIVTVLIGVNDIHGHVSAETFRANYDQILSRLKNETQANVYVINIPYIGGADMMLPPYRHLFDERTKQFNGIIKALAAKYQLKYVDLYTPTVDLFKKTGSHYSVDSFHPSAEGYKIWADLIYADLNK